MSKSVLSDTMNMIVTADHQRFIERWNVSRETIERLIIYETLLRRWQPRINLVSSTTLQEIWTRHFADSLQLIRLAPKASRWADLGSGAGFPGLVLALGLMDKQVEGTIIHLFESNGKKCAFLREVIRETGCTAQVHDGRIEDQLTEFCHSSAIPLDVVTARALAPLPLLLQFVEQVLTTGTRALFLKGQDVESELAEASRYWVFKSELHRSLVDQRGMIVEIAELRRRI